MTAREGQKQLDVALGLMKKCEHASLGEGTVRCKWFCTMKKDNICCIVCSRSTCDDRCIDTLLEV